MVFVEIGVVCMTVVGMACMLVFRQLFMSPRTSTVQEEAALTERERHQIIRRGLTTKKHQALA